MDQILRSGPRSDRETNQVVQLLHEKLVEGVDLARGDRDRQRFDRDVNKLIDSEVFFDVDDVGDWRAKKR